MRTWVRRAERGYSFIELLIVTTILLILAAGIQPLAREVQCDPAGRHERATLGRLPK